MDLEQRLKQLEGLHDWSGVVEALEQGILSTEDATRKADYHLQLGRLLYAQFLQGVRALKHFQDAYKLNPAHLDALSEARAIYWELGKLNMVQKLLELQLKNTQDASARTRLFGELGDVYFDLADYDRAAQTYAKAVEASNGAPSDLKERLLDAQLGDGEWQERIAGLLRDANDAGSGRDKARSLLRAARIARRFAPGEVEGILGRAYAADPANANVAALYEGLLVEAQRTDTILETQREALKATPDTAARADLAYDFGARWALRHQNAELGAQLLEESLRIDPARERAFTYLKDLHGAKSGEWERLVRLADELTDRSNLGPQAAYLLSQAGLISWKQRGDMVAAKRYFERLATLEPDSEALLAFEAQIGEKLSRKGAATAAVAPVTPAAPPVLEPPLAAAPIAEPPLLDASEPSPPPPVAAAPAPVPAARPASAPPPAAAGVVDELREKLRQQEAAKRYHEYVKTLIALGDAVSDPAEREEFYSKAADLYATKFANQAEAVKAYEKVLDVNPNSAPAIAYLREMYEKRRDWEKLIQLGVREAETLPPGGERADRFKQIALLATERVKKPEVCIQLWSVVLDNDPYDLEALNSLSQLYDRSREYGKLADVLQKLAELTDDVPQKVELLNKLGGVAGDRLKDEERAVEAYRMLLALDPNDRRAQEQLKKRYVTLGRWDDLEVFYAESGKWDEFIRVLESNETRATDTAQRIGMLMKIAELWVTQKGKLDRAARAYEKVLSLDENNLAAAERLIPIYAGANNAKGLSSAIEVRLSHVSDAGERLDLLREAANLYETRLNDRQRAFERYLAAFELGATDPQSQSDVERAAQAIGRWEEVVSAYRGAIARAEKQRDAESANHLRLRLGRVLVEEVRALDDALTEYRTVYDSEPDNATALAALERLYRQAGRWPELLDVYAKKRELATEPSERRAILFEIARLQEEQAGDPKQAIETYVAMLDEAPDDVQALSALDRLYRSTESWEQYAEVLRRRIELETEVATLVDLKYRLAETQQQKLSDEASALENYREILFLDPDHPGSRGALEGLLKSKKLRGEAAAILEGIYEARGDWEKLINVLEILAAATQERDRRVQLLRKMAATASTQLGALDRAVEAQSRALKEDPSIAESRDELEELAARSGAWEALIRIYGEVAQGVRDPELSRQYWLRLAAIEERRGMVQEAAKSYERLLAANPSDDEALAALDALYRRTGHWEELISVFRRRIELTMDAGEREALYAQMANTYDEKLGKPDEAIAAYREVLALDPTSQLALSALDALLTRLKMWEELAENLETQLGLADTDEGQLSLMLRLAALREREMKQVDVAIEGYRLVIERDPENEQALSALERLGQDPAYSLSIAEILEPLYRGKSDYQRLINVYEVQVARADDANRKVELLHQIASLYEDSAGNVNSAFDTMARALSVDPASEATQRELDRLARATGRFQDLAQAFEQLAAVQREPDVASVLYASAARVFENDVGSPDRAIELYRKVLSIDPINLAAAEALEMLFQSAERYADMSLILQRKAEILDHTDQKKDALFRAAMLEEEVLGRQEDAIAVYIKVLDIDPEDLRSVDALVRLYLGLARWQELLVVYSRKADLVLDPEEKKLILYQVGAVYERELRDVSRATDTYQKVLELDPDDLAALGRLDVLYQTSGNWRELLSVLQHEAELTNDPSEAVSYQYRIAELYEKHLGDVDRAVELYREILNLQPDHAPTLSALEGIKNGDHGPLAAASVLEPVYESMGEWQKLISVLEVQVRFVDDPYQKVDLLHRIARLCEENLGDHARAFETYARAVEVDSQNEDTLGALERLGMLIDRWPAVAKLYDRELDKLEGGDPARSVDLGLRVAQVYETQLDNVNEAVARYRRVLVSDPENQSAVRSLDRLFTQTERWADLAEILAREADVGQTPEEILEFKYRLGQVYQTRLGDVERAIQAYREVISAAPEHTETLRALEALFESGTHQLAVAEILEPLYQATSEWEKLIRVREAELEHSRDSEQRIAMFHRIGEDAEERLLDPVMAFNVYVRAIKESPLDERTGEDLERLASMLDGGWEQLANAYADVLSIETIDGATLAVIGKRLARVFEEELADVAKAEETYRYVLTLAPNERDALANLDRIYSSLEQWAELSSVLEQRAEVATEVDEKVELFTRLGQVYEERLGQVPNAVRSYRVIFDQLAPNNEDALLALGRVYEANENWGELQRVYERELENAVGDVQEAEIRAKMAHLFANRLGNVDAAIDGWKRVLDLRGEDREALGALAQLYDQQGKWAELTDVLERHFDIAETDEERVSILTHRARLFAERLNRDDEALETWQRVLDIDFSNVAALRAIAHVWRTRQDPNELVSALHATIDRATALLDAEELASIYRELGTTYGSVLSQPFEAADAWRHLLEVKPGDFEAMTELERVYREDARWTDVIGVKMQRAEAVEDPEQKISELLEVTELWKKEVNDYDQATLAFQTILGIQPAHQEAFEALERLHTAAGRWENLIELYLSRLDTRETAAERADLLRRIAHVFDEHLDDKNQAFDALVNALSEDFGDDETARYLERTAQATNRWNELIHTANAWLPEQTDPKRKIQICLRLGKWYGEDLGHPEYAQPYYQQIMALDPNNVQVLRQMAAIHRMSGQWQKVGETLTRAYDVAVANEDRKVVLLELGELTERNLGQPEQGISYYRRALEIDPLYLPVLSALERMYEERNQQADLVQVLQSKVKALGQSDQVAGYKLKIAGLYEAQISDAGKAAQVYREVLELDGGNLQALRGLERICEKTQDWPDLVGVLERELDVVETERERVEVLIKLALIQEEHFLKFDLSAQRLEQALEISPAEERAYVALERCYRRLKQWLDLINTYERHIAETSTSATKVELYFQIAQVYADEVGDVDRAIDAYRNIVDLDDLSVPALDALSRLYEKQGDAAQAIDAMTRVADLTTDSKQRVEMYFRIGRSLEEKLGDRAQAQERLEMALDLDPAHLPTLSALRSIAVNEADWDRAARYLEQEQLNTQAPRARARLLVELGKLRDETLGEHDLAIQSYELAIQCDEDCEEAALPLVEEYVRSEKWKEAEPLAEMLVKKSKGRDRAEQHTLNKLLGRIYAALGSYEKALKSYQTANQLDLTDQDSIRGIADVAFELKEWATALTNYQKVLTALSEQDVEARTDVYYRLGCIKREQGQARQAINNFEKALGLNPEHRPTLEALVDIYSKNKDWKQVAAYKRQILDGIVDGEERYQILNQIGEIWSDREKNPQKAIDALEEALELKPRDHVLLHKLLTLYQSAASWQKMVDTLEAIASFEERPETKARYVFTQAQIYRDKIQDLDRAVELFNEALDLHPGYLEAFERINKVLTQQKNWKALERSYRKMLHRIAGKGNNDLEHTLWHQLGLVYRDRLQNAESAIESFRMASTTKPGNVVIHQILAELYEVSERWDDAIVEQRVLLEQDALNVDAYRALYRLYLQKSSYDEAWCLAAALAFLRKADPEENRFFEDYRPQGMLQVRGRLSNDTWAKHVFHPDENLYVSKIFEMIAPAALQAKVEQLKSQGKLPVLDKRSRHDPATSTVTFAKTFGWAAQVLGIQPPELYIRSDLPGAIVTVPVVPPASLAGQTVLTGFQPQDLAFMLAKHLASYRGEHYIRTLFPTQAELTVMMFAGIAIAAPNTPMPQDMAAQIAATARELAKHIQQQPVQLEGLRMVVKRFIEEGAKANIKRWNQAVELTACRAGLIVCGDLEIAKKILAAEPQLPGDLSAVDKMKELLLYFTSDSYFEVRRQLGIVIQTS